MFMKNGCWVRIELKKKFISTWEDQCMNIYVKINFLVFFFSLLLLGFSSFFNLKGMIFFFLFKWRFWWIKIWIFELFMFLVTNFFYLFSCLPSSTNVEDVDFSTALLLYYRSFNWSTLPLQEPKMLLMPLCICHKKKKKKKNKTKKH